MMDADRKATRRLVALLMIGSAALMGLVAALVLGGVIAVSEQSRLLVGSVLAAVAGFDLVIALYFVVSNPS
jgi:hypothetical protein